ncbi:MAG TPA: response regulator [Anaerolineae bacterium]|nr:response regulator [Anaerolineae bacterium]
MAGFTLTNCRKRILIIDDDLQLLFVWRAALTHIPHQCVVDTAQDGYAALEKMASLSTTGSEGYDLIIMNLLMAHTNGYELAQTIRLLYGDIPIVWLTSHKHLDVEEQARQIGIFCCLDKPISLALMRQVVWEALEATQV